MVLFTKGMSLVQFDDFLIRKRKTCPPAFKLDIGYKQHLPFFVGSSLCDPHDPAKGNGSLNPVSIGKGVFLLDAENRNSLAREETREETKDTPRFALDRLNNMGSV